MGKMLVPALGLVVIGVLAWFLIGNDAPDSDAPPPNSAAGNGPGDRANDQDDPIEAANRRANRPVKNALPRRALPKLPPKPLPAQVATDEDNKVTMRMPEILGAEVQETVRAFYGNLPKNGRMPDKVTLDEVLPRSVIDGIGASPSDELVLLSSFPANDRQGYEELLQFDPKTQNMVGVSWKGVDGQEKRSYVKLLGSEEPPQ